MKTVAIGDFLTDRQIRKAMRIHQDTAPEDRVNKLASEVTEPNLAEINRKLGQENDARYLAYVICFALDSI